MKSPLGILIVTSALLVAHTGAAAQQANTGIYLGLAREGYRLDQAGAEALEATLAGNPGDLSARTKLLGFYFRGAIRLIGPEATIAARRRHILWLVQNQPGSPVAALSEVTIDARGHALADKDGYEQLSALWKQQAQRHAADTAVLGNAAKFFQLSDKERTIALLKQAQAAEPGDRKWPAWIGYVYALSVLGVDMMNQNGLPTSHNADEAKGLFAARAAGDLATSTDPTVVGVAGRIVGQYGLMLAGRFHGTNRFAIDYAPLAEALLLKAQQLEPGNALWPTDLEQFRKLRAEAGKGR